MGFYGYSLESVKKNKVVLRKIAVSEEPGKKSSNLSEEVRRTLLDDTFWHESEAIVSLLKPWQSAITQLEEDSPNLADICRLFFNFKDETLRSIDSFPFTLSEQEEIKFIIEVRKDFCIKIIHKAAYFLDPREQGRLLNDDDRDAAIEFVYELAEKLSSCKMLDVSAYKICEECSLYSAKGFFEKWFLQKSVSAISPIAWWNGYCGHKELNKIACKILRLPATSAAVERSFSCYSNVHTGKRKRLSNERAAKVVFVSQNISLDSESYTCSERPVLDTASPGSYASCCFHSADKVIEIDSRDCSSDSYILMKKTD